MPVDRNQLLQTVRDLTLYCPRGRPIPSCPFALLGLLTYETRTSLLASLSDAQCLELFSLPQPQCTCPADPRVKEGSEGVRE